MNVESLTNLQDEYRASREAKTTRYQSVWRPILDEYGLRNFGDIWQHVQQYKQVGEGTALSAQGRVGSLNVLVRKMAGLMGLRDPEFMLESKNPWDDPVAMVLEHAFEANRAAIGWNKQNKMCALDSLLMGTGMSKVGYGSRYLYDEPAWSAKIPAAAKEHLDARERTMPYGLSTEASSMNVQEGMPMMIRVSPADVFYNLGVMEESDIRRIYHRWRRPVSDVLHDSRFDNKAKAEIQLSRWGTMQGNWMHLQQYEDDTTFVEGVECYDVSSRQYCVFQETGQHALRDWTPFPFPIQDPYERLVPIPCPQDVWGIPYALLILGQAQAMNRSRGIIMDAIARDGKTIYLWSENIDAEYRRRIENSKDGEHHFLPGFDPANNPNPPFVKVEFGGARPEILELTRFLERDQAWVSGLMDAARNDTGQSDETATAVSVRAEQQGLTVDEFVQANEDFQEATAIKMMKIMLQKWDPEKLIKVVGPNPGLYFWTRVNLDRMLGTFTLKVVAGSSQRRDRATQRKQWQELLPRLAEMDDRIKADMQWQQQTGQPGAINWQEVLRETLDLYDSTLSRKILRPDNLAQLVVRLMQNYGENPVWLSPELEAQVRALAAMPKGMENSELRMENEDTGPRALGLGQGPSVPFEVQNGVPAAQGVNQATGGLFSETPGMAGRLN